jgi:hypothetical protein
MRSARLLAVAVLAVVLALSSAQNAFATVELAYDGTGYLVAAPTSSIAVRFSLQAGWSGAKLLTARYYVLVSTGVNSFTVHIFDEDRATDLTTPFTATPSASGWFDVDLSGKSITVTRDFYVVFTMIGFQHPFVVFDPNAPISGRSWYFDATWVQDTTYNYLIRAVVDPILPPPSGAPVGGVVMPANNLAIAAPWLAVIGLVGCIGTVVVVAKKRRQ